MKIIGAQKNLLARSEIIYFSSGIGQNYSKGKT